MLYVRKPAFFVGISLSLGIVLSSAASAADLPLKTAPTAPIASSWVFDVHGGFDLNFANTRVTGGGLYLYNHGYVTQPEFDLSLDIYKNPAGFINKFTVFGGMWNEFWSSPPPGGRSWQEMDWWIGASVVFAKYWTFSGQYLPFNFPGGAGAPPTAHNYDFKLALDDSFLGWPITFNPYVELFYNAAGGSTVVYGKTSGSYRVSMGIVPTVSLLKWTGIPVTISAPTWMTVGPSTFWNRNDGTTNVCGTLGTSPCALSNVGYYTTGVKAVLGLDSFIPKRLGSWYLKGGVQFYHINNDALRAAQVAVGSSASFAAARRDITVTYAGVGFTF